jgi:quercetin dioxygenase-like cupin family protein
MEQQPAENYLNLIYWWKNILFPKIENIETTDDLGFSPVEIAEKTMKISISHPAIKELRLHVENNSQLDLAEDLSLLYYENAILENGSTLENMKAHVERIHRVINNSKPSKEHKVAKFVRSEEAEKLKLPAGEDYKFLLTAKDTNNIISVFDCELPKDNLAPYHFHEIDAELFYILKGEVEIVVEGISSIAKEGDIAIAGTYVNRSFKALQDSRLLIFNVPAGPSENQLRHLASLKQGEIPTQEWIDKMPNVFKIHPSKK